MLNSIQFCSKNSINIHLLYKYIETTIFKGVNNINDYQKEFYLFVKWNSDIAAATEAFKLEVLPLRGILNRKSHFF